MGLSSLHTPSSGVLCILLINMALIISFVKGITQSLLNFLGVRISSLSRLSDSYSNLAEPIDFQPDTYYIDEFRSMNPTIRYESVCNSKQPEYDCSVCLTQFELESEINSLSCGHFFHKVCLEKWLHYSNITCPLCRTPLLSEQRLPYLW